MPFRDRVKRALGRSHGDSSDDGSFSKSNTGGDSNVYQPGEPMPKAKYRQPVDKKHKENLEAFSFMRNSRKTSYQSQYSPMDSEMPSRSNSVKAEPQKTIANGHSHVGQMVDIAGDPANVGNGRVTSSVGGAQYMSYASVMLTTFAASRTVSRTKQKYSVSFYKPRYRSCQAHKRH